MKNKVHFAAVTKAVRSGGIRPSGSTFGPVTPGANDDTEAFMLVLLRRSGIGWIGAFFDPQGRNIDLVAGEWKDVRLEVLRSFSGAAAANGDGLQLRGADRLSPGPGLWRCLRGGREQHLDPTKPEQSAGV